jgi:hypothetical protein
MIERLEDYIFEERDDARTRFNFVDSSTESTEIKITTMLIPDSQIDKAELERELEEMVKELETKAKKHKEQTTSKEFWSLWTDVVDLWVKYQAKNKLYDNAISDDTSFVVNNVVAEYYGGRLSKLLDHCNDLYLQVTELIRELNCDLVERGFRTIDIPWLVNNVSTKEQRENVRDEIKAKLKGLKDPIDFVNLIEKKNNPD